MPIVPDAAEPKVFIIVLNWNGLRDTLDCLSSLAAVDYPNFQTVVVDNGSGDGSVAAIAKAFPKVTLLPLPKNLGFVGGNNHGIEHALAHGADFVFLLNNDTTVDPGVLRAFVAAARDWPQAGVFAALIYFFDPPNKVWFAGGKLSASRSAFNHLGMNQIDDGTQWLHPVETDYACGCAFFARASAFRAVGLLDPRYFLIWEEADWCYRLRRGTGQTCMLVPAAKVWHKVSASFSGGYDGAHVAYYWWRNRLLWVERHHSLWKILGHYRWHLLPEIRALVREYRHPTTPPQRRRALRGALCGVRDYALRRFGPGPKWLSEKK